MDIWLKYILAINILFSFISAEFMGPAEIQLQRLEKCGDDNADAVYNITINKFNRTHNVINYIFETKTVALDEHLAINMTVSKWGDGGWKPHLLDVYEEYACQNFFMKYIPIKFKKILRVMNLTQECPIPPSTYELKNYVYDGQIPVPMMYGDFKTEVMLLKDHVLVFCIRFFVRSVPKKIDPPSSAI